MRISIKCMAIAAAILWGGAILLVGLINLANPTYGVSFLTLMTSVYPGFHSSHTVASVMIGTLYGMIDGLIAGCVFTWLYDALLDFVNKAQTLQGRHT